MGKAVIGLSWEPKLPALTSSLSPASSSGPGSGPKPEKRRPGSESGVLWKPSSELIDGLFVPPSNPKKLNKLLRTQVKDTAGSSW